MVGLADAARSFAARSSSAHTSPAPADEAHTDSIDGLAAQTPLVNLAPPVDATNPTGAAATPPVTQGFETPAATPDPSTDPAHTAPPGGPTSSGASRGVSRARKSTSGRHSAALLTAQALPDATAWNVSSTSTPAHPSMARASWTSTSAQASVPQVVSNTSKSTSTSSTAVAPGPGLVRVRQHSPRQPITATHCWGSTWRRPNTR